MNSVIKYSRIKNGSAYSNGELIFSDPQNGFDVFSYGLYSQLACEYSKFHKMDNLSRLGFLCAELLLDGFRDVIKQDPFSSAIVLANANGSLDTDLKYHRTRLSLGPSPAIFVYTLPNIVMGEICIRNGIKGENIFFLDQEYDIASQVEYVNMLLDDSIATHCIAGWVDLVGNSYDGFLYLTKKGAGSAFSLLETKTIEQYYNN